MAICALLTSACGKKGCDGPPLNYSSLKNIRNFGTRGTGPRAFLVLPNPIDATSNPNAQLSSTMTLQSGDVLNLLGLLSPSKLENSFLKIRIRDIGDALSTLAKPNSNGDYVYRPDDVHYSEVMAYRSITSIQSYIEGLGFSVVKTRPLYVMVQASGSTSTEVNAFYDHGYLNPGAPRTIKLFGSSQFAPGIDQDMYWHEFGHLFNESVTRERGMDFAGDSGAMWSEGSALHECLADYLSESVSDKPYIGRWIARNLSGFQPGDPLRSALDPAGARANFKTVATADGTGFRPERYEVAEWCTRVLWEIRESFVDDSGEEGAIDADRLMYAAATLLGRDTSFSRYQDALLAADSELYCGGHDGVIQNAFESRGFFRGEELAKPLAVVAEAFGIRSSDSGIQRVTLNPGSTVAFAVRIRNVNAAVARNVRVRLEPRDTRLFATTYQQAFGDIPPGRTINIGTQGGLPVDFSVVGEIDERAVRGQRLPYRIRVLSENAPEAVFDGEIRL